MPDRLRLGSGIKHNSCRDNCGFFYWRGSPLAIGAFLSSDGNCGPSWLFQLLVCCTTLGYDLVSSFVVSLRFLSIVNEFGISRAYLEFATVCLLAVLVHIWQFVETKGRF
ncbi:hypothetical protein MUK42_35260 [Musa troglodytarum]|uniref:Uncharacterized protein n=1 Tax=Musa troglodytarum TaxID=320322 RepID=A0A9E7G8U6_9LILI|nr:hypothetical protein MUK42_35260 [Musa troglodytarum]